MRDDKVASPVISTYAVGGDSPAPRRGAGLALPVMVILGTASVAAIVSVSFEGETPITADQTPREASPAAKKPQSIARAPDQTRPNISVSLEGPPLVADATPATPRRNPGAQDLPRLSVLQPNTGAPVARPASPTRGTSPGRLASRPGRSTAPPEQAPPSLAASCGPACDDPAGSRPAPSDESAQLGAPLNEAAVPLVADDYGELADLANGTELVAPDLAVAPLDEQVPPILLADSRPALSAGTVGPTVTDSGPEPAQLAAAEARAGEFAGPLDESGDGAEDDEARFQPSTPAVSEPGPAAEEGAGTSIPQHLARIGERYAAVPAVEPAAPGPSAIAGDAAETEQPAYVESSVALDLGEATGSSVIVQDDELVAIRLGELVSLLEDRLDHPLYVWLSSSAVASKFVTAETLAAAGIRTRYDPQRRQLVISTTGE
jgi:hypothetical protein